jgi:hypothetical protein
MATNHGHGPNAGHGVEYDKTDLGAKGILIFFIVLGAFAIAMQLGALALYAGMTKFAEKHEAESNPLAPQTYTPRDEILTNTANVNIEQFPQPRLEASSAGAASMNDMLLRESKALTAEPWQDAQGNVHLPIEQAMRAVLPRLAARAGGRPIPDYPGVGRIYSYPVPDGMANGEASHQPETVPESGGTSSAGE